MEKVIRDKVDFARKTDLRSLKLHSGLCLRLYRIRLSRVDDVKTNKVEADAKFYRLQDIKYPSLTSGA